MRPGNRGHRVAKEGTQPVPALTHLKEVHVQEEVKVKEEVRVQEEVQVENEVQVQVNALLLSPP